MKPIYQMTLGISPSRELGLVFSSEIQGDVVQSPIFTIPVPNAVGSPLQLQRYISEESFYFPALLGKEVIDLRSEKGMPFLSFRVPGADISISFDLQFRGRRFWRGPLGFGADMPVLMPYVGAESGIDKDRFLYAPLNPVDLLELDDMYRQRGFAFVGLTPKFGGTR